MTRLLTFAEIADLLMNCLEQDAEPCPSTDEPSDTHELAALKDSAVMRVAHRQAKKAG